MATTRHADDVVDVVVIDLTVADADAHGKSTVECGAGERGVPSAQRAGVIWLSNMSRSAMVAVDDGFWRGRQTLDIYTRAVDHQKREASLKIIELILPLEMEKFEHSSAPSAQLSATSWNS